MKLKRIVMTKIVMSKKLAVIRVPQDQVQRMKMKKSMKKMKKMKKRRDSTEGQEATILFLKMTERVYVNVARMSWINFDKNIKEDSVILTKRSLMMKKMAKVMCNKMLFESFVKLFKDYKHLEWAVSMVVSRRMITAMMIMTLRKMATTICKKKKKKKKKKPLPIQRSASKAI